MLVTAHRRDNFGEPLARICRALRKLLASFADIEILWPVHPNPSVRASVLSLLQHQARIHLCEPLAYGSLVTALQPG